MGPNRFAAIAMASAGLLALAWTQEWSGAFLGTWAVLSGVAWYGAIRSSTRIVKLLLIPVALLFGVLALLEGYFWNRSVGAPFRGAGISGLERHPHLGYAPRPGYQGKVTLVEDDVLVYEVEYTFGVDGLRVTQAEPCREGRPGVLFFGGSFTLGEGVEDAEALPAQVAALLGEGFCCHNFGYHGYGPHQMLAAVQSGLVREVVRCRPRFVVYQFVEDHARRVVGRVPWGRAAPWYTIGVDGELEGPGRFDDPGGPQRPASALREWLLRSHLLRDKSGKYARRLDRQAFRVLEAILVAAQEELTEAFPGSSFLTISYESAAWETKALARFGFGMRPTFRVEDIVPGFKQDDREFMLGRRSPHPRAQVYAAIAEHLSQLISPR